MVTEYFYVPGNIDQAQYCERIKGIIELLGSKLSLDELSKIWRIQVSTSAPITIITQSCLVFYIFLKHVQQVFLLLIAKLHCCIEALLMLYVFMFL